MSQQQVKTESVESAADLKNPSAFQIWPLQALINKFFSLCKLASREAFSVHMSLQSVITVKVSSVDESSKAVFYRLKPKQNIRDVNALIPDESAKWGEATSGLAATSCRASRSKPFMNAPLMPLAR